MKPDPNDGRSKRIAITGQGRSARDESIAAISHHLVEMETAIGRQNIEAVLPVLAKLRSFLDQRRSQG
jgi:DNA-binding MarR family transcriptional regulator